MVPLKGLMPRFTAFSYLLYRVSTLTPGKRQSSFCGHPVPVGKWIPLARFVVDWIALLHLPEFPPDLGSLMAAAPPPAAAQNRFCRANAISLNLMDRKTRFAWRQYELLTARAVENLPGRSTISSTAGQTKVFL